tara:strand:+ start:324 stop:467 length:144 start_codon:yes stop_codon:yes gene_type:complete
MRIKVLAIIKNYLSNKKIKIKQNNSKQKNLKYSRNKYGFFSLENKEK